MFGTKFLFYYLFYKQFSVVKVHTLSFSLRVFTYYTYWVHYVEFTEPDILGHIKVL